VQLSKATFKTKSKPAWQLGEARVAAAAVLAGKGPRREVEKLLRWVAAADPHARQGAAYTLRCLSDSAAGLALLHPYAEALMDAVAATLSNGDQEDWRTRGHLMLLGPRICRTSQQRSRCAALLLACVEDPRGVLRANVLEGLARLAAQDAGLQQTVEPLLLQALRSGTPAERLRARDGLAALQSRS